MTEISNKESIDEVEEISKNNNGSEFKWAANTEERNKIWKARHNVYYSVKAEGDNIRVYVTDVCVPISNIVECIKFAENEISKYGFDIIGGEVYDVGPSCSKNNQPRINALSVRG